MITKVNPYGHISLTNDYFSGLVEQAAKQCYGIAAMGSGPGRKRCTQRPAHRQSAAEGCHRHPGGRQAGHRPAHQGRVGLNISTITQSITHRVKDEVELATGLKVARIDVYVDDVIAD